MDSSSGHRGGFSAFHVGDELTVTLAVTEEHFAAAPALFGDSHPMHVDNEHARRHGHPSKILSGTIIAGIASSALAVLVADCGLALLEYRCRFRAPVYLGDTLTVRARVQRTEPKPHRGGGLLFIGTSVDNQRGELVAEVDAVDLVAD